MPPSNDPQPLITLDAVTLRLRDRLLLPGTSWEIRTGEHWAVIGPNGAGKSTLVRALTGEVPAVRGRLRRHGPHGRAAAVGLVSFELGRRLMDRERRRDAARHFSGDLDAVTSARSVIFSEGIRPPKSEAAILSRLGIDGILDRGIGCLSTGEFRKVLIARTLLRTNGPLILDEPFEGLDADSRRSLADAVAELTRRPLPLILVTHRASEIPDGITHILELADRRVVAQARRADADLSRLRPPKPARPAPIPAIGPPERPLNGTPLVEIINGSVSAGGKPLFSGLNWRVRPGERWLVVGPNGAGKSTLLRLIAGDHPQAYANEIHLFGRRRGTGETVWEIKQRIGLVSAEVQTGYQAGTGALETVISGFYDSVGLYRRPTPQQTETARQWLAALGMAKSPDRPFGHLSQGEQRRVLIARAMVKRPSLLILDEPCGGLDPAGRARVIELTDGIGRGTETDLIFVTHHSDEVPRCITHVLRFQKTADGPFSAVPSAIANLNPE